jgi:NADH dehydrogenase FAD-containing subunit
MKVYQSLLKRGSNKSVNALVNTHTRSFAGGAKIQKMAKDATDFDICIVGGLNATALTKFLQNEGKGLKMAIITDQSKFLCPELYFLCSHSAIKPLKLESGSVASQVDASSRVDANLRATKIDPSNNKIHVSNGKEYTYRALVYAPGFDHTVDNLPGLREFEDAGEETNVFSHIPDKIDRLDRNYLHGFNQYDGDYIVYDPARPFKNEGASFYALYYEQILRQDTLLGRTNNGARLQYWTPNKSIFEFGYANDVALEECHKRGIDVHLGWELLEVKHNKYQEKVGIFRNVDTGETVEKDFHGMSINPPSKPQKEAIESGLTDANGLIDVNPYTLQHRKYDNVFSFGSATNVPTSRSQHATMAQNPIVKHNVQRYLAGKSLNAIYNGYTYMPLLLGQKTSTSFQHFFDHEPHKMNHAMPQHGIFGMMHFKYLLRNLVGTSGKYTGFKKNYGPPNWNFNPRYDDVEHNEYLVKKGVDASAVSKSS